MSGLAGRWRDELPFALGLLLGAGVLVGFGFVELRAERVAVSDFSYVWAGGRAVLDGLDPYAPADWRATLFHYGAQRGPESFYVYPPWVTVALLPLAALPLPVAAALWTFGGMALAVLALRALLRAVAADQPVTHSLAGVALLASQPGIATFWSGQWTFLLVAGLATATLGVLRGGAGRAAATLLLLGKVQLFTFALIAIVRALLARGRMRELLAFALPGTALMIVGWALYPHWIGGWLTGLGPRLEGVREPTTIGNALGDLAGAPGELAAAILLLVLVAIALRIDPGYDAGIAAWSALSVSAAIYTWSYDHLVLLVPLVVSVAVVERHRTTMRGAIAAAALGAFLLVPTLLYTIANAREDESYSVAVPLAVTVFALAVALRHPPATDRAEVRP